MAKPSSFFKNRLKSILEESTFYPLWDFLDYWIFNNAWIPILFIIFLGVAFEIILVRTCEFFKRKFELWENGSSGSQKNEDGFPKGMTFALESWSITHTSSAERIETFSGRVTTTSPSEENGDNSRERAFSSYDDCEFQESHFCESHSSSGGTSGPLSMFHSKVKKIFISHRKDQQSKYQEIHFSASNLFSIMKSNSTKDSLPDDVSFQSTFQFIRDKDLNVTPCPLVHLFLSGDQIRQVEENIRRKIPVNPKARSADSKDQQSKYQEIHFSTSNLFSIMKTNSTKDSLPDDINFQSTFQFIRDKDLNVTPCPLVHLFLSDDQIRQVEENIRRKIPVNPKARLVREADCLHHQFQEPLIYNVHSNKIFSPPKAQDTFVDQNAIQNQMTHEAHFTRQTQEFIYNQESVSTQHSFAQPLNFMTMPFSSSMQDSFQAQDIYHNDKSQHFIDIPCIVEIKGSTKDIKSDEHISGTQNSIDFNDPNKSSYLVKEQRSDFQNAEFLSLSSHSFAEAVTQQNTMPEAQQFMASLDSNQYHAYSSMSLSSIIKKQGRKILDNEKKLRLKVLSLKAKKMSCSQVFPIIVCHTSGSKIELRCKKKKIVHQRKIMSDIALYLISKLSSKLITRHVKKYFIKSLKMVIPDLINHEHFLQEQHRLTDTEKTNYPSSTDRVSLSITKNIEHSSMINTKEVAAPCSLFETSRDGTSEDSVQHTLDLNIPKHEALSEVLSESLQKDVSLPKIEVQKDIQTTKNVDELTLSIPNTQKCFLNERIQNAKNLKEIDLSFSGINLLITLVSQKHEKNELKDINVQVITRSINLKEEKPLMTITEYDNITETDSEKLESNASSNTKNRHQYERVSDTSHDTMQAMISEPCDMEIYSKLKAKADTPIVNYSHSELQEKLLDEKKIQELKHIDDSSIVRKPQECNGDKEKSTETVPLLTEDLRVIVCLKQKVESVQFEMGQEHLENKTIQSKEKKVESQTISTQTVWETSSCPSTEPLQVEKVWQRIDKATDTEEAAGPMHPPSMPENLPTSEHLIEKTECCFPFNGKDKKSLDGPITEDKEDWIKDLCAVATGPFKTRKKSSGTKNVIRVKHKIIKVKKPAFTQRLCVRACDTLIRRRRVGGSFESTTKQMLCNAALALRPLSVHPQRSSIPNNTVNIQIAHPKPQVEKEEHNLDSLTKENEASNTLEVQSCHGGKVVGQVLRERGAHSKRSFSCDTQPVKEVKMESEMFQAEFYTEATENPVDSLRMDSLYVENIKNSTSTQTELLNSAESELGPPTSEKLVMGDSLSQSRESSALSIGNDAEGISCAFTQKALLWLLTYCMPILTRSKKKKDQTKFANISIVKMKYVKKVKPPASKTFTIRGNKKSKLSLKAKFKKISQAKAFLPEWQNTVCLTIDSGFREVFHHAQLKQGEQASKVRVAYTAGSSEFYNREKKPQKEKQNPFLQHGQHLWADADERTETLPDLSLSPICQRPSVNSQNIKIQNNSLQNALKANLQMDPLEAEGLQKTTKAENGVNFPVVPKILSEVGTFSPGDFANQTDENLEFKKISESKLDLYPVVNYSETSANLPVTFLQSSDSVTRSFVYGHKGERKTPRSKKQTPLSQRRRTMSEIEPQTVNFRFGKKLKCNKEMKDLQQRANIAAACLYIVPSKAHILSKINIRRSKPWTEKQRIRRLGHLQLMQEKSPSGRNAVRSGSADASSFSSLRSYGEEGKGKPEDFPTSKKSPCLVFGMNQEKDHNLLRSDKQLNQVKRTTTQVVPQILTEAISCSATFPIPDEFPLEKPAPYLSVYPLKFGEVKNNALSKRECGLSHERQPNKHTGDSEKEAKELSVSYINPNHSREMKCYSTQMKHTYQEKNFADETSSSNNAAPEVNMSNKIEKGSLSEKAPCFMQMKSETLCHKGKFISDEIKEIDIQDKEEKQNNDTLSMLLPRHSQHFIFYSHPSRDPNSHKGVKQRGRDLLFIVEQDVAQQSESADKTLGEYDMFTSSSKLHSLKSEESQIEVLNTVRKKCPSSADGAQAQELNKWTKLDRDELKNDLQPNILESLNLSTPGVPRSKRQSKVFTDKTLQGKMSSTGVTMKGKKAFVSKVLTIPQCGHRKKLLPKTLKSQICELLIKSGVLLDSLNIIILGDPTLEKSKRLTQKLAAIALDTLDLSTPTYKESKNLKFIEKGDEMSTDHLAAKARATECVTPKQCKPVTVPPLNAISSMPVSLDVSTCTRVKDRDIMWTRSSHELHSQSVHEERSCHAYSTDKDATSNGTKDIKSQGEEGNPLSSQHFSFSSQTTAGPNSVKSGLQLINSAPCCELERALYDGQAQPVSVSNQPSSTGGVMLQLLNTEESEIGPAPCDNTWDRNPKRKYAYPISEQKAWSQKNLRTLKPLQEPSLTSSEKKGENCTLQFPGKREVSPMTKQASKLLSIARQNPRVHKKKRYHNSKHLLRKIVHAIEAVEICALKLITDKLLLNTAEGTDFYRQIPQRSIAEEKAKLQANLATTFLGPYNFQPALFDFKSQVNMIKLPENESVLNQRFSTMKKKKLLVSKIIKISGYSITNHKKVKLRVKMKAIQLSGNITDILQNTVHFISTTNRKSKFKAEGSLGISKFTQTQPIHMESLVEDMEYNDSIDKDGSNTQESLENALSNVRKSQNCLEICEPANDTTKLGKKKTDQSFLKEKSPFYLTEIVTSITRNLITSKEFKKQIGNMRMPNLSAQNGVPSQVMEATDSQSPHVEFETLRTPEIKVDNDEVNTNIKFVYPCIQHIKTELSHKIWDIYRKSAKGNRLNKAIVKRKEEFGQPVLFKIPSQRVQPFEADQMRQSHPFKPEVFSANMVHPKDITLQKRAIYLIDQEGNTKAGEEFGQEAVLPCNAHSLHVEKQNNEFKTGWKTTSSPCALLKKQEKPTILEPMWGSYASDHTYLETTRQKDKAKVLSMKSAVCVKQIKLKAKKTPVSLLLAHGGRSSKKELGHSMQHQSTLELRRNIKNLFGKTNLDPKCFISPVKILTRVKLERGELEESKSILPQVILEKPSNQRQMSGSGGVDESRKLEENIKEAHDHSSFKDTHQQFWVKSDHTCKPEDLRRRMNSELTSQKAETDSLGLDNPSTIRTNVYSDPQDSLQHKNSLEKGTWRPEMALQPMKPFSHFRMTNEIIMKQDIKPSSPQRTVRLEVMDKPFDSKELLLTPSCMVQQQNLFTDPLLGSISPHVPHQPHTEESKEVMKISNKILNNLTQQQKNTPNEDDISDMDHMPRSIEKLLLLIKEQEKRRKKSRGVKKIEVAKDIKTTMRKSISFLNDSPSRTQFINSGMSRQRDGTEPKRSVDSLCREQRLCVQGISLDGVYTDEPASKVTRQNRRTPFTESVLYQNRTNTKVRKTTSGRLLNIAGYRSLSFRKELRHSMKTQKELAQVKMVADLIWKELCASGYLASQIKKLMEVREGKGKLQKPYIPPQMTLKKMNETKRLSVQPISSTVRKPTQYTIKHKEHQMVLLDIIPQNKDPVMTGQQVKELRLINFNSHLEPEAYRVVFPETGETDYSRLEAQRPREIADYEFSTAQSIKQGVVKDSVKHALSIPPRRGGPKKINILSPKEHDVFLMGLDTFQEKACKVQELLKQSTPRVSSGSVACPVKQSFDSENTKVPKKVGMYHSIKNISHISGKEGLRETDTELGSKAQASLCPDLEALHKTVTAQKDCTKTTQKPRIIPHSVHCHKRAPFYLKQIWSPTMKDSGVGPKRDLKGKEKAEPVDSPLKLNRQKVDSSKKLRPRYLVIFIQNKEQILEFFLSCILYQLQYENTQKQISAKAALHPKVFKPVVEKTSSEVNVLGDQSSSSEGVTLHTKGGKDWQENACKAFQVSNPQSLMDIHRITPPQIKKALKAVGNLDYNTLNREYGEQQRRIKKLNQHYLPFSFKNPEEHVFCSPNYSYVQSHLEPQAKEALSKEANTSSRTKGLDLSSTDQLSTACECRPKWIFPSIISEQSTKQDEVVPLESGSKTIKCPGLLLSERKQSSDGTQRIESVSNDRLPMLRVSTKELLSHKATNEKQQELYLPEVFMHCLLLYMQCLHENVKLKDNIEYGVMKDIMCLERKATNLKRLEFPPNTSTDYAVSHEVEPQCSKREKMICMKHRKDKPGSVVIKACEPFCLPHFKLDKEKIDVSISRNVRQEKYKSQEEESDIKEMKMAGITGSNIMLKTKESILSYSSSGRRLTLGFDTTKQGKVQEMLSKSDMKQTQSFISLPCLSQSNLNTGIKVEKNKSELLKDCLPPLKPLLSLQGRKVPFSNPFNRDNLCDLIELNYLPQRKEYRNNMPHLKDIITLKHIARKGKKPPFKYLLHEKEPWWDNKIQKFIQGNKNNLDVVQSKPWDSVPSSPFLEWDPKTMEAYLREITKLCLGSPAVLELSGAMGMYRELTDGVLRSIKKANHMPLKERLQIEPKEVLHSSRLSLRQKLSSASQELQYNAEEKEKGIQGYKKMKNWNKPFMHSLSYSHVDTRLNGEEAMQIKTQSSSHCSKLQRPSNIREIVYKKPGFGPVLNSVKHSLEYVMQKEESTKTEKDIHLKENQTVSQKIQLDIKETEQELQELWNKDELNAVATDTSTWTQTNVNENLGHLQERKCKLGDSLALASLPHSELGIEIIGQEIESCSLLSQSMESSDSEKLNFTASSLNDNISGTKRSRCLSSKEEDGVNTFERITAHPKAKHVNMKKSPLLCVPKIKRFKADLEEQSKKKHESSREKVMPLRETCSAITSSDVVNFDTSEEVETETMKSHVPYPVLKISLSVGQIGSTKTIANNFNKRKLPSPWEEEEVQTPDIDNLTSSNSSICMTKISAPSHVSSVKKHRTELSKKRTHCWNSNENTGRKQERARRCSEVATKRDASIPLLTTGQIAPTNQISTCSKKRKILPPVQKEVQTPATDCSTHSSGTVLKAKISAPTHVFSLSERSTPRKRKTPHGKNKEQVRQKQEKARTFNVFVTNSDSSVSSGVNKEKDIQGKTQFSLPLSEVKDISDSNRIICVKPSGYVLRSVKESTQEEGKNILRKEMKEETIPKSIDKKVKNLPRSYTVSIKTLQSKIQGEKLLDLASTIVKLQLKKFSGSQTADRKVYSEIKLLKEHVPQKEKAGKIRHVGVNSSIVHPKNIHLKAKRSSVLPMQNLNDFQWKTRKQGGKVKEDRSEPQITVIKKLSEITTAMSPQPSLNANMGIKEECAPMLTRPSVLMGHLQKSTDSEKSISIQSTTGNSSSSQHSEKHLSEEKKEVGKQIAKLIITHKYLEIKAQKPKNEQGLALTKSSLSQDLPHPQSYEKRECSNTKLRLRNPALQRISMKGETVPREVGITVGDTMKDVKNHQTPQREEPCKKEIIEITDRRGTDITLKSRKSLLSQKLHRTELYMHIKDPNPKKHDDNKNESRVLRKMYTSKVSLSGVTQCKGVQVVEANHLLDGLESKPSCPLPQIIPTLSNAEKITQKEDMCTHVGKGKQYSKQIEKTVDLTIEVPGKKAKVSPISCFLSANKFVLNMKVLEKKVHKNKSELTVVASRTFLSIPSAGSKYSQDKTQKGTAGFIKSHHPQENFQEPADTQNTATRELSEVDCKCIFKAPEHNVLLKQTRLQKSKCMTRTLPISQHPHIESDRRKPISPHQIDFTKLGAIIGQKVLDMSLKCQKGQPGKYKKEPSTKTLHCKKKSEIKDTLSHEAKFPVSRLFFSEKIPLKKLSTVHSSTSQDKGKQIVRTIEQAKPSAKGELQVKPKSFPFHNVPVPSRNQWTSLQINVDKKTVVNISPQTSSGVLMNTKEMCVTRRKEDPPMIVPAEQNLLEQKLSQTSSLNSLYAYIPICPKSQKIINLKRELKPKYSTMRIPKHPISKMLGIMGWSSPGRKRKLEYAFNKPKTVVPRSKDTSSGIIIRSLCVSMINPLHNEGIVESKTNSCRDVRVSPSKLQEKLPDSRKIEDILIHRHSFDTIETRLGRTMRIDVPSPGLQPLSETPLLGKMSECPLLSKQGEAVPGTMPTIFQDRKNEDKTLIEHLFPIYKMLKGVFEVPVENKIQKQVLPERPGELEAYKPGDAKAPPLPESPTIPKICASLLHTPLLKQLTPELKNKLTMHLICKATEIKLNQIPEIVKASLQKYDSHPAGTISEDHSHKFHLKPIKTKCKPPKVDICANLKNKYERDFPPLSCVKTSTTKVSSGNKGMTEPKDIKKRKSVTLSASLINLPLTHVLHKFSKKEKDNLFRHLCTKTMEIQTRGLPRIAAQSYALAIDQDKPKPLFKCIHSATKVPKRTNRVVVLFDEKSFCEIDSDLQHKYLRSLPNPSVTVVSTPKALPKHTSKVSKCSGSPRNKVGGSAESSTLSFDKEILQHVSFPKINPQESSLCFRNIQEPTNSFYPCLQGTEQNDIILSDLNLQMTSEKDKKSHVWFQKASAYKHSVSGTQQNTAGSHSSWISDDWTKVPTNTETSTEMGEHEAPEESNSEECVFIETNFYLTQDSEDFPSAVPNAGPSADIHIGDKTTYLKPLSHEDPKDSHTRTLRKHTPPVAQPLYQPQHRKCRSNSKMQHTDWLTHNSSSTVEIESTSSSITFDNGKHWTETTWSRTSFSLTSLTTESGVKLNLAKKHGNSHMNPQLSDRKKARSDIYGKSSVYQSSHHSHLHSKQRQTKKRQAPQMLGPNANAHWQNIRFYSERKESQPFFYVCVPADSMDVIPQTVRWVIPPKILQKRNFQIPRVANISNSWNFWSSSKRLLESLTGAFNTVR
ncbi:leucine-rich repeat transmembrane protein CCDC168 isoform X2 [Rattus norvegicus]|uniref:leucine-rich repeat transmembrane protein CCDC168 isoform X2 n=1 Tax=Rattus norvegicus TaxID=10116 RepID=UPI0003D085D8|nr:leucine-rich repeat transmembrane protein CCDC168 isoform X2 [Rattus norvegicus]|eukprot:XP_017452286.1 PREDICTED: coiled-coil domain-containing protein 168 isoform X2 [Rattus norvegicus]